MITYLLDSLAFISNYEIIFILNGIYDTKTLTLINSYHRKHKYVKVIKIPNTESYAKVNNIAVQQCSGEYILLLNSDVIISVKTIQELLQEIKSNKRIGAIQPLLIYPQNYLIQSAGHIFCEYNNYHAFNGGKQNSLYSMNIQRQALTTACCCIRKEIYQMLNGMDEFYHNAFEGMELTLRITQEGFICYCKPDLIAFHYQGISRKEFLSYEKTDIGRFWANHGTNIKDDFYDVVKEQLSKLKLNKLNNIINCSNLRNIDKFSEECFGYKIPTINIHDRLYNKIIISNNIPSCVLRKTYPYLWLTTNKSQIIENKKTFEAYSRFNDIIIDLSGNLTIVRNILK